MYEILQVSPTASLDEIKSSHKRLSLELMSNSIDSIREECAFQLQLLDVALHTLSVPALRNSYDAQLAPEIEPGSLVVPVKTNIVSPGDEAKALRVVAAIEDSHKLASMNMITQPTPMQVMSSAATVTASSLKKLMRVFIGLMVLGFVVKMGLGAAASIKSSRPSKEVIKAEELLVIQAYYEKYGIRPASGAEAKLLEEEMRRKENEIREAEFLERRKKEEFHRFVEESRDIGNDVSENLRREEARLNYEKLIAERKESEQRQAQAEQLRRQDQDAVDAARERIRIENERRSLGLSSEEDIIREKARLNYERLRAEREEIQRRYEQEAADEEEHLRNESE